MPVPTAAPHVAAVMPMLMHLISVAVMAGDPSTVDGVNEAVSSPAPLDVGVLMLGALGGPLETTVLDAAEHTSPGEWPLLATTQHLNECTVGRPLYTACRGLAVSGTLAM